MEFFDRKEEIARLHEIAAQSEKSARFTVITGRRRIGKTSLVLHAYGLENLIYWFVSRKSEKELCSGFTAELSQKTGTDILGSVSDFASLFEYVMKLSCQRPLTLFIDEFQDFALVNSSIFSDMQRIWDIYKDKSSINLIVGGSANALLNKIFRDKKEPLFQRETAMIKLKPFTPSVIKEILGHYKPDYSKEDLLALYTFTGGVAKYIELLLESGATTLESMLNYMIRDDSVFIDEGRTMLVGEFGKEYGTYFSILTAIARGRNSRAQIEDVIGRESGGYLTRLEDDYELITKRQPIFETTSNKNVRYYLNDNFITFWFRFIFKYSYMVEIGAFAKLREVIMRDYSVFSGFMLERYFRAKMMESGQFTRIGGWWDRKGLNEIDIIAADELDDTITAYEVKRNEEKIDLNVLRDKVKVFCEAANISKSTPVDIAGLSMRDM